MVSHPLSPDSIVAGRKGLYVHPLTPMELTVLQMSFDGPNGSIFFADDTGRHSPVAGGNAQIDTSQSVFGGASGWFDGFGSYVVVPGSPDWDVSRGAFTADFRARFTTTGFCSLIQNYGAFSAGGWEILYDGESLYFNRNQATVGASFVWEVTTGQWYHVGASFDGHRYRLFVDGIERASEAGASPTYETAGLSIGSRYADGTAPFHGHLDELKIRKRRAVDFSVTGVPGSPY